MTPKEKAIELMQKIYDLDQRNKTSQSRCKQIALLCVDEIQKNNPHKIIENKYVDSGGNDTDESYFKMVSNEFFWQSVKNEISLL